MIVVVVVFRVFLLNNNTFVMCIYAFLNCGRTLLGVLDTDTGQTDAGQTEKSFFKHRLIEYARPLMSTIQ